MLFPLQLPLKTSFNLYPLFYAHNLVYFNLERLTALIISASRRTDLPAFYTPWFIQRIEEGFCRWQNPFNPKQTKFVSLRPEDVTAFVFWSKNPKPLLPYLPLLDRYGYRYYFQYTLNSYPLFEPLLPELSERLAVFRKLSQQLGAERWSGATIPLSSLVQLPSSTT